jgi:hypothetical protein
VAALSPGRPPGTGLKKRGRAPNNRLPAERVAAALERLKTTYRDFGPTFAAEKLAEGDDPIMISHETLRKAMIAGGLWSARHHKTNLHRPRDRRPCIGELVQGDGSPHAWFENRGPRCTLICFIDDASSRLLARFALVESAEAYFPLSRISLQRFGPCAMYVDRHSILRNNNPSERNEPTQFGRAMEELGIELICARSPQAKGRVERVNQTLQDRLVRELRLRDICTIDDANAFLDEHYLDDHNRRFAVAPSSDIDVHRALEDKHDLDYILCSREMRTLSRDLTFQYKSIVYALNEPTQINRLRHAKVEICKRAGGEITVEAAKQRLSFFEISKRKLPAILDSKELADRALTPRPSHGHPPPENHPWKRWVQPSGPSRP